MQLSTSSKKLIIRIVLFLFYLIVGAGIFMLVEKSKEKEERNKASRFTSLRKNFTERCSSLSKREMEDFLLDFEHALRYGYDVKKDRLNDPKWRFMNSFYFVGNIVTTIGYGHMVPETTAGRLFCMLYALIGIPLTALMLRSVGNRITEWIIATLKLLDRRIYNRETENAEIKSAVIAFVVLWLIIFVPAIAFWRIEKDWNYLESIYYCFITFSTIGFGDLVPTSLREGSDVTSHVFVEFGDLLYLVIGLAIMSSVVVAISGVIESKTQLLVDPMEAFRRIDMENLNSVAVKKLGLKMNGTDGRSGSVAQMRRPSEVPNGHMNRRNSRFSNWEETRLQERSSADRIDHVGPAPVISIQKQQNSSRNGECNSNVSVPKKTEHLTVPVDISSSLGSPTNSPQPPPVFKSNKVTPVDKEQGCINVYCETVDETVLTFKRGDEDISGDEGSKEEDTDESSVTGLYDLHDEQIEMANSPSEGTFKLRHSNTRENEV